MARAMPRPPPTRTLLLVAGLLAWGAIAQPFLLPFARDPSSARDPAVLASFFAHVAWLGAFLVSATRLDALGPRSRYVLLAAQSIASLALVHLRTLWLEAGLLAIVAAQASLLLSRRASLGWVLAQTVAIFPYYVGRADVAQAAFWTAGVLGFQLFATTIGYVARHEAEARAELLRVNAELRAAEVMLAEGARTAERLHIARELHDAVGHHLTALGIHLELAAHACPDEPAIAEARGIAKSMLAEVRAVVRAMREDPAIDLPRAVEALASGFPTPKVHFHCTGDFDAMDPVAAHALFRAAQEGLTNAARHAGAENVFVSLEAGPEGATLVVRDDGRGAAAIEPGSGILGLVERAKALGGEAAVTSAPSKGSSLRMFVPTHRGSR